MQKDVAESLHELTNRIERVEREVRELAYLLNERQQGDIDYIAMETGVDLDQDEEEDE